MNKLILIGRISTQLNTYYDQLGQLNICFNLAVNQTNNKSNFIPILYKTKNPVLIEELKIGRQLCIQGSIISYTYNNQNKIKVYADMLKFL